ncbi:MAG: CYTH domain-containing protein [Candidatus Aenigmarchaeota archaeon]|nr:CYTH domain-containing protein [Candidatus Aenigmarchaeota archaeon]
MIELERTFLLKYIPDDLRECKSGEIIDLFIPKGSRHPVLRIRKNGEVLEMTKKCPVDENDISCQKEQTIVLSKEEYDELMKLEGKSFRKIRYYYDFNGIESQIDVYQDALKGLIVADFEFETKEDKNSFEMPDFCIVEVTQEEFLAGGMLCGKSYSDIEPELRKLCYEKLFL